MTTTLRIIASLFDVILVKRWNITFLGIKDEHFYLFGDSIIYPISYTLDFMPAVMLTAQLCPQGQEAIMYSVLAGFSNFGQGISGFLGAFLTDVFGIRTKALSSGHNNNSSFSGNETFFPTAASTTFAPSSPSTCDFSSLGSLIIVAHAILPALTLPLVSYLVPNTTAESHQEQTKKESREGESEEDK